MKIRSCTFALFVALVFAGCASYSTVKERRPSLRAISPESVPVGNESTILRALRLGRSRPLVALEGYLSVMEAASRQLEKNPDDADALRDYNFALARVFATIRDADLDPWNQPLTVPGDNGGFVSPTARIRALTESGL
jgi:hypothetical protein